MAIPIATAGNLAVPVTLSRYAEVLGIPDTEFWGVVEGAFVGPSQIFWTGPERQRIAMRLRQAEELIAAHLGVYLYPRWTEDERHPYVGRNPIPLWWKHLIAAGQRAVSTYAASATVVYSGDYGIVTVPHGGVGQESEVRVYYADDTYTWGPEPIDVDFQATNIVITFPRQRLVSPAHMSAADVPVHWVDIAEFITRVTVARVYNDPSVHAYVRVDNGCVPCDEVCQTACVRPTDARLSWVNITPAVYTSGSWVASRCFSAAPQEARVYYWSGLATLPVGFEDIIIRLAHTLMPEVECPSGKDTHHRFWKRDRRKPEGAVTRERVNCPWGMMDGAWAAWMFVEPSPYNYGKGGGWY